MRGRLATVAALGTTQTLTWASTYYLPAILAVPMANDLGLAPATVFAMFSGALVVAALLGPMAGRAIDRHGGRGVMTLSSLVVAAGLIALAFADGPVMLAAAWLVLGIGMAIGLYDAAFAVLAWIYGSGARGPITGITLIAGFASTIGWPASAVLEAEIGWRSACLVWAGLHLLIGLPINRLLIPAVPEAADGRATARDEIDAPDPPRHAMALLAFTFAAAWFVTGAMAAHLPRLLEATGTTPAAAVALAALVGPAQVAARLVEFGLFRRFHPLVSARLAAAMHPIGAAAVLAVGTPAAGAFVLLHGGGNGLLTIARGTVPLALFGPIGYGLRQGLLGAPARLTQATAPFLFGLLIDAYGAGALAASAALSLAALAALTALRPVRRPASLRKPET